MSTDNQLRKHMCTRTLTVDYILQSTIRMPFIDNVPEELNNRSLGTADFRCILIDG